MSQDLNPMSLNETADVEKNSEDTAEKTNQLQVNDYIDYSQLSMLELVQLFQEMLNRGDQQEMYKKADVIKAEFYKVLRKEKIAIGFQVPQEGEVSIVIDEEENKDVSLNPFAEMERGFKQLYTEYKILRSNYIQIVEKQKEENYIIKNKILDDLKILIDNQDDLQHIFPAFRDIQLKWKQTGPVPQSKSKDIWERYQFLVEKFYDYVKINNELRDLDFKKNYELKLQLCEKAELLSSEENIVIASNKLQKLHDEWREIGPVFKEHREELWEKFKASTASVNKRQQEHFETLKDEQKVNLEKKIALCEKCEEIVSDENKDWNVSSKKIEDLQAEWKKIGFASKKDNQKIYDRFRKSCDTFYNLKREHYSEFKNTMQENFEKKIALCEQAEVLKDSEDWKKTTDQFISLQKRWKEIGPVARKQSDLIWKRFRTACDYFFEKKAKHYSTIDQGFEKNMETKLALIDEINSFKLDSKQNFNVEALRDFQERWAEIGFVPIKEKERIQSAYRLAIDTKFADYKSSGFDSKLNSYQKHIKDIKSSNKGDRAIRAERDKLIQKYRKMESDISVWENNMGFFAKSKNADALIAELEDRIVLAKDELAQIEAKIKLIDKQQDN